MKLQRVVCAGVVGVLATLVAPSVARAGSESAPPYDRSFTSGCQLGGNVVLLGAHCYVDSDTGAFEVTGPGSVGVEDAFPVDGQVTTVRAVVDVAGLGATTCINGWTTVRITLHVWVADRDTGELLARGLDVVNVDASTAPGTAGGGRFSPTVDLSDQGELENGLLRATVTVQNGQQASQNLLCPVATGRVTSTGRFTAITVD
jgi:hypothetical protein